MAQEEEKTHDEDAAGEIDPIWTSSRTARQIYALGQVEKDVTRLLSLAASCVALLTLPQTDAPDAALPQDEERSEQFVLEASEYFERLDTIQVAVRSSLAHIRQSRIAPSAIHAPPHGFVPPSLGVGVPPDPRAPSHAPVSSGAAAASSGGPSGALPATSSGLQEARMDRKAWVGILGALTRLAAARERERVQEKKKDGDDDDRQGRGGTEAMDVSA